MIFPSKEIQLKNGKTALLRSPRLEDAKDMADYLKICASETHFLLRAPEECTETTEQEADFLQNMINSPTSLMIVCEVDGKIAGNCQINFNTRVKTGHRANIGIALIGEFWGLGIGTAMFEEMIRIAKDRGVYQLELEVIEGNDRAMGLYRKMGFEVAAAKPDAIRLKDGTLLKEYFMVKKL